MQPVQRPGDLKCPLFPLSCAVGQPRAILIGQRLHSEMLWSILEVLHRGEGAEGGFQIPRPLRWLYGTNSTATQEEYSGHQERRGSYTVLIFSVKVKTLKISRYIVFYCTKPNVSSNYTVQTILNTGRCPCINLFHTN